MMIVNMIGIVLLFVLLAWIAYGPSIVNRLRMVKAVFTIWRMMRKQRKEFHRFVLEDARRRAALGKESPP